MFGVGGSAYGWTAALLFGMAAVRRFTRTNKCSYKRPRFSAEYLAHIKSDKWKAFKARIVAKRGRRCQDCGQTRGYIDLHHLTYVRLGHERESDVRLLCRKCHDKRHPRR